MVDFSYKGGWGVRGRTCIVAIKRRAGLILATDKRLQVSSNITLFKTVIPLRN